MPENLYNRLEKIVKAYLRASPDLAPVDVHDPASRDENINNKGHQIEINFNVAGNIPKLTKDLAKFGIKLEPPEDRKRAHWIGIINVDTVSEASIAMLEKVTKTQIVKTANESIKELVENLNELLENHPDLETKKIVAEKLQQAAQKFAGQEFDAPHIGDHTSRVSKLTGARRR